LANSIDRLILQNGLFADKVTFVGVVGTPLEPRIITRQPHIPGEGATRDEIISMMIENLGFRLLPERFSCGYAESLASVRDDVVAIIDAIPTRMDAVGQKIPGSVKG